MKERYDEFRTIDDARRLLAEGSSHNLNRMADLLRRTSPEGLGRGMPVPRWAFRTGEDEAGLVEPVESGGWMIVGPGFRHSGREFHGWLRRDIEMPEKIGGFSTSRRKVLLHLVVDYDGEVYLNGRCLGYLRKMHRRWDVPLTEAAVPGQLLRIAVKIYKRSGEMTLDLREASLRIAQYDELHSEYSAIHAQLAAYARGLESLPDSAIAPAWMEILERAGDTARSFATCGEFKEARRRLREAKEMIDRLAVLRRERPSIVRGPYLQSVTETGITAVWETDVEASTELRYGESDRYGSVVSRADSLRYHKVRIEGLSAARRYHLRVGSGGFWSKDLSFRTAPESSAPFRMVVWGDCDGDCRYHESLLDLMVSYKPDIAVCTGDIGGSMAESLRCFFDPIRKLRGIPFYIAIGNHEYGSVTEDHKIPVFERLLGQPGNGYYFSFDHGNSHFIVLDPHRPHFTDIPPESDQGRWLVRDLGSQTSRRASFRFVFIHEPPFSQNWEGTNYDGEESLRRHLVPVMERYKVSVVFSGHAHDYERGRLPRDTGPFYVVTGGANNNPDYTRKRNWPHIDLTHSDRHFVLAEVGRTKAEVRAIDKGGRVIDSFVVNPTSQ